MDKPSAPATERGGKVIADRYKVDRLIARGGMAAVYLARHVKLNRPIALKILSPPADAEDPESFVERFRLEAETLASLDHSNIVILHDYGETEDGRFFLAMEYIDGPRVSDILRAGPLEVERALNLIIQVCSALRYAHKRGLVHRDLKPSNLLIRTNDAGEEVLKVVDFGLVKLTEQDQSITRAGLILGSPHCMAPEQVKGLDVDHRTDIYAIGILLFRILTGQYPFHGSNSAATMIAHLNQAVPTFYDVAPDLVVPAGLEEIVRKCLAKSPGDRYTSMAELMADLATCMDVPPENFRSVSQSHSSLQAALPATGERRRSPFLMFILLFLVVSFISTLAVGASLVALGGIGAAVSPRPAPVVEPEQGNTESSAETPSEQSTADPDSEPDETKPSEATETPDPESPSSAPEATPDTVSAPPEPEPRQPTTRPTPETSDATAPENPPTKPTEEASSASDTDTPEGYFGVPDFE